MRARKASWALLGLVAALALVVAVAAGGAGASPQLALDQSWTDPAGDAVGGAPDLTAVAVSNDAAGTITMNVTVPMVARTAMYVFMDTGMNGKDNDATDRWFAAVGLAPGVVAPLAFDGLDNAVSIPSLRMSATTTIVTLSFAKADVGIDKGFGFWLATETEAQMSGDSYGDEMPNGNFMYLYVLSTPTPPPPPPPAYKPVIGAPATTPATAVAGKRFTVTFPVTRSDTGAPLTTGTMTCDPSVSGKVVAHAESFKGGTAKLSFVVPKTAKGKVLKVKVTITDTRSATKIATFKVR